MALELLYSTLSCGMLLFLLLPGGARLSTPQRWVALTACMMVALLPMGHGLTPTTALRGAVGDLSVITVCWLAAATAGRLLGRRPLVDGRERLAAASVVLAGALLLYPAALGLTGWDPYRLGYGPLLPAACLVAVLALAAAGYTFITAAIALALVACALRWLESPNLWDYLLDPALGTYAAVALITRRRRAAAATAASAADAGR